MSPPKLKQIKLGLPEATFRAFLVSCVSCRVNVASPVGHVLPRERTNVHQSVYAAAIVSPPDSVKGRGFSGWLLTRRATRCAYRIALRIAL